MLVRGFGAGNHEAMIEPDLKDWTWVLHRPCPECGFDSRSVRREEIPALLRKNSVEWRALLAGPGDLSRRPRPDKWSPLEYACHVRDVCRIYSERLGLMLTTDDPHYPNWDQDETAVRDRYAEQNPRRVATELGEAADILAARFEEVAGADWKRTGNRSDGAHFTVESFARYFIHDPVHHLYDVTGNRAA